ncbi:RNA-binding protein [Candidatus Woesearchaeota archaeon]|nr:MAG: RNA-binding protein [Candidatus Woesearchaeota archaeon]
MAEEKSSLYIKDKDVVVPGEILAIGLDYLPGFGTYRLENKIIASRLGLINVDGRALKITPLSGKYLPKRNDVIICKVIDITLNGWRLDTNSAFPAMLSLKDATSEYIERGADLSKIYNIGEYLMVKIVAVTSQMLVDVSLKGPGLKKLPPGRIIKVNPMKVPRIIGKQGSMVSMVKKVTGCRILVGQNGVVWIQGDTINENLAIETIKKIEQEAHVPGLTEKIEIFLKKRMEKKEKSDEK